MTFLTRLGSSQCTENSDRLVLAHNVKVLTITQRRQSGVFEKIERSSLAPADLFHAGQLVRQIDHRHFLRQNADKLNMLDAPALLALVIGYAEIAEAV